MEYTGDRTPAIAAALRKLARARGRNKRKYLQGAKKGYMVGGKSLTRGTFVRKIGGVPKSWKKEDSINEEFDQLRIDYLSTEGNDYIEEPAKRTDEGYLAGRAVMTNVGVFPYRMADGSVHYELRPPEEVFHPDSLKSLSMCPLTNDHPSEIVRADNIKEFQVGHLGDSIMADAFHISAPYVITDENAIIDVNNGKRALSCGYKADIEETSGRWMGVAYDAIQRKIRYNHVALVDSGRAGDAAKIRLDSIDANIGIREINYKEDNMGDLKTVKIDGVDYQAEASVVAAYTKSMQEVEQLKKDKEDTLKSKASIEAERDQFKDDNEKLKKDREELKKSAPDNLERAVQSRMVLLDAARRADIEVTSDLSKSDEALRKAVITKLFPETKEKLDGLDMNSVEGKTYLIARFDAALENLDAYEAEKEFINGALISDSIKHQRKDHVEDAYNKMVKRAEDAWKDAEEVK